VCQSHTGRLTGFWFLLNRPNSWILMNERMIHQSVYNCDSNKDKQLMLYQLQGFSQDSYSAWHNFSKTLTYDLDFWPLLKMNCQTLSKFFLQNIKAISILLQTVPNWPIKVTTKYDIFMLLVGQGENKSQAPACQDDYIVAPLCENAVLNLLHVAHLAPRSLRWLLDTKKCAPFAWGYN